MTTDTIAPAVGWSKHNIVKLSLAGAKNRISCNACGVSEAFGMADTFTPIKRPSLKTGGKTEVSIKTHYEFVKYFTAWHLAEHTKEPDGKA